MAESKSGSQGIEDRPHPTLFKLPEYTRATGDFLGRALNAIAGAQHPLLGEIKTETHEFVPRLDTTISATQVISREPTDELVEMSLSISHGAEGNFDELYMTLSDAADKLGSAYMKRLFDYISDVTDATGNVLNGDGTPRWDVLLQAYERMEWHFDLEGNPSVPQIVVNPKTAEAFGEKPDGWDDELADIIERKRKDWDDRRRHRRLPR